TSCRAITVCFFFQAEDGIRAGHVTGVQTCALPIFCVGITRLKSAASNQRCAWAAGSKVLITFAGTPTQTEYGGTSLSTTALAPKIGRASCRESVYVEEADGGVDDRVVVLNCSM